MRLHLQSGCIGGLSVSKVCIYQIQVRVTNIRMVRLFWINFEENELKDNNDNFVTFLTNLAEL